MWRDRYCCPVTRLVQGFGLLSRVYKLYCRLYACFILSFRPQPSSRMPCVSFEPLNPGRRHVLPISSRNSDETPHP